MIFHLESVPHPPPRGLKPRRVHRRYHVPNAQRIPLSSPTFQHFLKIIYIYIHVDSWIYMIECYLRGARMSEHKVPQLSISRLSHFATTFESGYTYVNINICTYMFTY